MTGSLFVIAALLMTLLFILAAVLLIRQAFKR